MIRMQKCVFHLCVCSNVKFSITNKQNTKMSRTNKTRRIKWHQTCKCKCRLDASVCNNKQCWNADECRCKCKELIDKSVCDRRYIWNPSNCECEYDKSCDGGECLDYKNCRCRKKLVNKLVEECTETVNEVKIVSENK